MQIHSAAEKSNPSTEVMMMLIDANPGGLKQKDRDGNLPIHSSLENRYAFPTSLIAKMLTVYPGSTKVFDKDHNLPLHCAYHSYSGKQLVELVKLLLATDPKAGLVKDKTWKSFLLHHMCKQNKSLALIKAFCKGCPKACTLKDAGGNLPLHVMCEKGDSSPLKVIECLISWYPEGISIRDRDGNTGLHSACECLNTNLFSVVSLMLGVDAGPNCAATLKDKDGNLAIHSACESKRLDGKVQAMVIDMLVDAYPSGLGIKDRDGNMALHSAIERGDTLGFRCIKKIVDAFPDACAAKDKEGTFVLLLFAVRSLFPDCSFPRKLFVLSFS